MILLALTRYGAWLDVRMALLWASEHEVTIGPTSRDWEVEKQHRASTHATGAASDW